MDSFNYSGIIRPAEPPLGHVRQMQKPNETTKGFCTLLFLSRNPPNNNHNTTSQGGRPKELDFPGWLHPNKTTSSNTKYNLQNNDKILLLLIKNYHHYLLLLCRAGKNPPLQLLFTSVRGFGNKFALLF